MNIETVVIEIKNAVLKELPEMWKDTEPKIVPIEDDEYEIFFRNSEDPVCECCDKHKTVLTVSDHLVFAFVAADDEGKQRLSKFIAKEILYTENEDLRENITAEQDSNQNKHGLDGDGYEEGYNKGYDDGWDEAYDNQCDDDDSD